jgi:hypothetical protein
LNLGFPQISQNPQKYKCKNHCQMNPPNYKFTKSLIEFRLPADLAEPAEVQMREITARIVHQITNSPNHKLNLGFPTDLAKPAEVQMQESLPEESTKSQIHQLTNFD